MGGGNMVDGMLNAIETGYIEGEIANTAFEYQRAIESKERVIVGVNDYPAEAVEPVEVFEFDQEEEGRQLARLREVKRTRSNADVDKALSDVKRKAEADENLFPGVLDAVKASATEGEVMGALRDVYGEYTDPGVF